MPRRPKCHRESTGRGFTLIELLVALLLVSIVVGVSSYFLAGKKEARLEPTGWALSSSIRKARMLARTDRLDRILIIDLDARTFGIDGFTFRSFPPGVRVKIVDPQYGEISRGEYRIIFTGGGGMEAGTILLEDGKKVVAVRLDPVEGAILSSGEAGR